LNIINMKNTNIWLERFVSGPNDKVNIKEQKGVLLLLILFVMQGLLSGCSMMITTHSMFKLDTNEEEKVDAIVQSAFMELGYKGGHHVRNKRSGDEIIYYLPGQPFRFQVFYKKKNDELRIEIKENTFYESATMIERRIQELSRIAEIIIKKLRDEKIKASVETESYKTPALCIICSHSINELPCA